jgi:hypothetical protein
LIVDGTGNGHLKTVCDDVQLKARSRAIDLGPFSTHQTSDSGFFRHSLNSFNM